MDKVRAGVCEEAFAEWSPSYRTHWATNEGAPSFRPIRGTRLAPLPAGVKRRERIKRPSPAGGKQTPRNMTGQQPPRSELRLFLALFCLCALQSVSGFPQPLLKQMDGPDIPKIERLALCFSQWTALSNRPQISNFVMNRCSSIFNSMQVNEQNNQEIYKRFLFHYSRAQEPTYPLKTGVSILISLSCVS
ncbi:hypothetical protein NDU88_006576 [Pleurodeles waltl]|uniref:Neuromedin-S n=1 Tax=Pleurodeles waltl TaxID=8319 RepID=A0AAV7NZR6_PLEWA|nr:hypothetical protein NDU88_006576 [Pleurodeles waltl]